MHDAVGGKPMQILLVEDNPGDVRLAVEALRGMKVRNQLHVVRDGAEAMSEIKQDADLRRIPVVILTSSAAEQDILHAYNLYANCYITKPLDLEQFLRVIRSIEDFWFAVVSLPPA
jgi:CheY-like chemotaxis protein